MTIRSISAIAGIFVFVRYVSITMIVRSKMSKPILIVGSLQTHAVIINIDRGGYSPCIGTTDFGLPKVFEVEEDV